MKKIISFSLILFTFFLYSCKEELVYNPYNKGINITPTPLSMTEKEGLFLLNKNTVFVCSSKEIEDIAVFFKEKINKSTAFNLTIQQKTPEKNFIKLSIHPDLSLNSEGYHLEVDPNQIEVLARTPHGLFYGMQTVMQLLPAEIESSQQVKNIAWEIPAISIKDEPRFGYRGQMLDVCRHFSDVNYIKKHLDILAMYKINKFHWHLTDDQGWRIEIKKYPLLTEIGSKRVETEGHVYGPHFFTQDEVREIIAYAKERYIEVIPEIELPGHAVAALSAYPEYSCSGGPLEVRNLWGISNDVYCAGNEETFSFLEDIIDEVAPLFESKYFHIGGDEAPKVRWENCPKCQKRIQEEGLIADREHTPEQKLQSYFVARVEKILQKHGKHLIGWDEILEGGLAQSATVMSWRGEAGGIKAASMNHDVIMTPSPWMYLDSHQGDAKISPVGIGGFVPLKKTYEYNPLPKDLKPEKHHHILGIQANVWTEYMYTPELVEYYTYPRLLALAEVAWSTPENKNYIDFERRMDNQRVRLDMHHVNYYIPLPEQKGVPSTDFVAFVDSVSLAFDTTEPVKIVYTTDGSEPTNTSTEYTEPLLFKESTPLKLRSILLSGKMSRVRHIQVEKQNYSPAVTEPIDTKGLTAAYYKGEHFKVNDLRNLVPAETECLTTPDQEKYVVKGHRELTDNDFYSTVITGYIKVPKDNVYYVNSRVDQVWIDDVLVLNSEGKVKKQSHDDGSIALAKGVHKIKLIKLSGIYGGYPTLWDPTIVYFRPQDELYFIRLDENWYL